MFDYESIKNFTSTDSVTIIHELLPIVSKAKDIAQQIYETYLFHIGEEKIEVWSDECNHEYLTHDGIWQARYLNQAYDIRCDVETIFNYMKSYYLVKNGFVKGSDENGCYTEDGERAAIFLYFNSFIKKTKEKYKKIHSSDN